MRCTSQFGMAAFILLAALPLRSQTVTTGSITGTVVAGAAGKPLAGQAVRLVSGQITRTVVTDAEGRFRAGLLNPGAWRVTVEVPGFQTWSHPVPAVVSADTPLRIRLAEIAGATVAVNADPAGLLDLTSTSAVTHWSPR